MHRKTERRRKWGWQVRIGGHSAGLIFIVACPLIAAGAEGATEKHTIASAVLKRSLTIVIDTPPEYGDTDDRYPVLHTLGGDASVSPRLRAKANSDASDHGLRPLVLVRVDQLSSLVAPRDTASFETLERVMLEDVMPFVEGRCRTIPSHEGRALLGTSRGAVGALMLAFKHPHLFSSVISYRGTPPRASGGEDIRKDGHRRVVTSDIGTRGYPERR